MTRTSGRAMSTAYWLMFALNLLCIHCFCASNRVSAQPERRGPAPTPPGIFPAPVWDYTRSLINLPPGPDKEPVQLVVLGVAKRVPQTPAGVLEVTVDKVLYGCLPTKTVRFAGPFFDPGRELQIWALRPTNYAGPPDYELMDRESAREELAQIA